jgi:hypothetical protein
VFWVGKTVKRTGLRQRIGLFVPPEAHSQYCGARKSQATGVAVTTVTACVGRAVPKGGTTAINSVSLTIKVPSVARRSCAVGTFDISGNFEPSTFLRITNAPIGPAPSGAAGR